VLAEIINGNHQYLGDLSIGEGTFSYYLELIRDLHNNQLTGGWQKYFFKLLWLLSIIDINEAYGGFMSHQKFEFLKDLYQEKGYMDILTNKSVKKERIKLLNQNYTKRELDHKKIMDGFEEVYLQYFIDFYKTAGAEESPAVMDEEQGTLLVNRVTELAKLTRVPGFKPYKFITFTKRAQGKQGAKVITEMAARLKDGKIEVIDAEQGEGFFLGYRFSVNYPYLFIDNEVLFK